MLGIFICVLVGLAVVFTIIAAVYYLDQTPEQRAITAAKRELLKEEKGLLERIFKLQQEVSRLKQEADDKKRFDKIENQRVREQSRAFYLARTYNICLDQAWELAQDIETGKLREPRTKGE